MHYEVLTSNVAQVEADVLVVGFFAADAGKEKKKEALDGPVYTPPAERFLA